MFALIFCFVVSKNKNTKNTFQKQNLFLNLLKIKIY